MYVLPQAVFSKHLSPQTFEVKGEHSGLFLPVQLRSNFQLYLFY